MKSVNVKCLICIAVLALVVNQAKSSIQTAADIVDLSGGYLIIVGKLLAAEGKVDAQTRVWYTDVTVEVVQVFRNITERDIEVGSTVNFRSIGGQIGNHTIKIKDDVPMVYLFGMKHWSVDPQFPRGHKDRYRGLEVGLPLEWVLEVMNMAITVRSRNPVKNPKTLEDIPTEVKFQFRRLRSLEKSVRRLARDGMPETVIIGIAREELARIKAELDLLEERK